MIELRDCQFVEVKAGEKHSLFGYSVDDPRYDPLTTEFAPGHRIVTSEVQSFDKKEGIVKTRNSTYKVLNWRDIDPESASKLLMSYPTLKIVPMEV